MIYNYYINLLLDLISKYGSEQEKRGFQPNIKRLDFVILNIRMDSNLEKKLHISTWEVIGKHDLICSRILTMWVWIYFFFIFEILLMIKASSYEIESLALFDFTFSFLDCG